MQGDPAAVTKDLKRQWEVAQAQRQQTAPAPPSALANCTYRISNQALVQSSQALSKNIDMKK